MYNHLLLGFRHQRRLLLPNTLLAHTKTCPESKPRVCCDPCSGDPKKTSPSGPGGSKIGVPDFKRAAKSGPVRFGFIPEEWFVFFYPQTGVSGSYVFGFVLINYLVSKEIFVMEHEYYLGLSVLAVTYYATTRLGPGIAKNFDAEIDAIEKGWEKGRKQEKDAYTAAINAAKAAQMRANGQKLLMDAKKENISMQLEAAYRERLMHVYRTTKGRLDYQVKKYRAETKIHQKWMLEWILQNVRKAITPEFEQDALNAAIRDLSTAANKM